MRTRILLFCRPLLRLRQQIDPGKSWPFIGSLILVLAGGYISVVVFGLFAKQALASNSGPSKDTVFVNLLNGPNQAFFSRDSVNSGTQKVKPPIVIFSPPDTNPPDNLEKMVFRPLPVVLPVSLDYQSRAVRLMKVEHSDATLWIFALVITGCLAGAFYIGFFNLPYLSTEMSRDLDPAELTTLFRENASKIEELGNPRKIKRLSTKIRIQYYYLISKKIRDADSLAALGKGLLVMESSPAEDQNEQGEASAKLPPNEAYTRFLKA